MSKPLEEWLKARRTIRVMGLIQEHSEKALQVTDEFLHMVDASIANRQQDLDLAYKREELREREGDALRRKILEELARGELSQRSESTSCDWLDRWTWLLTMLMVLDGY